AGQRHERPGVFRRRFRFPVRHHRRGRRSDRPQKSDRDREAGTRRPHTDRSQLEPAHHRSNEAGQHTRQVDGFVHQQRRDIAMIRRPRRRAAYTLLELILAMLIGMRLMRGLYVMLSAQLTKAQKGRDSIREATVVRAVLATIADDIAVCLGTYDPQKSVASSSSGTTSVMASQATASTAVIFNYGVEGD